MDEVKVGDRVSILVNRKFSEKPTHEVTGFERDRKVGITWILICPIGKLDQIKPGQLHVPVTRITSERIQIKSA